MTKLYIVTLTCIIIIVLILLCVVVSSVIFLFDRLDKIEQIIIKAKVINAEELLSMAKENDKQIYPISEINFTCFDGFCFPENMMYVKGIGICYNKPEGVVCPK